MGCVQSPGAAEAEEREVSRIVTAFNRDESDGLFHIVVHDIDDALREFLASIPFRRPFEYTERRLDAIDRERHRAAEEKTRKQTAEDHICVRHSEPIALAVADRTWIGACTFRTDFEGAAGIEF